ncbi:hypothetical protein OROHE_012162 [Orobanche hederae]
MGVPSFYRWLVTKYPKIVCNAVEEKEKGEEHVDCSMPNPNGMEFDNFYLDMNGIIHPCFHPEDNWVSGRDGATEVEGGGSRPSGSISGSAPDISELFPPTTYEEVFGNIYEYIDRLFNIVRPRKLLFMAIDGVAPRAKMNQQRARRFRTANDIQAAEEIEDKLRKEFEREGKPLLPKVESQVADSNVITPGTEFMHMLSEKLQSYISLRLRQKPAWAKIKVILSDDNVPGEGEHKIMSFIRAQRSSPGYDPNTRHCLYGLDADLIMLALATHEIHFSILREEVLPPGNHFGHAITSESSMIRPETHSSKSRGWFKEHPWEKSSSESVTKPKDPVPQDPVPRYSVKKVQSYQFLHVWILREYLALDMEISSPEKSECDLERIIDDFIFICFFAGNDFLPHLPGLEIHEGCIDLLMHVYKNEFQNLGGYLVNMEKVEDKKGSYVKFKRVERFILMVGSFEEKIFSKRSQLRERKLRRILLEHREAKEIEKNDIDDGRASDIALSCHAGEAHEELEASASVVDVDTVLSNTKELKQKVKDYIRDQSDLFKDGSLGTDSVKFGSPGWRERYYEEKFSSQDPEETKAIRKDVVEKYGEGLCWVLLYYFSGVPSWTWFYPYHYGPMASDLKGLSRTRLNFHKGLPFKPFDQLMGVLPPRSAHALPSPYKGLMINENSKIFDFYPTRFETDTDGKRYLWQGITKLPFIEEELLLTETKKLENELKDYEKVRNMESLDRLFVRCSSKEIRLVLHSGTKTASKKIKDAITMESPIEEIYGTIHLIPEADDSNKGEEATNNLCLFYEIDRGYRHIPRLLEHVTIPEKTVNDDDILETILWHEARNGNRYHKRRQIQTQHEHVLATSSQSSSPRSKSEPSPAFKTKVAGCGRGFIAGRGKSPAASQLESPEPTSQMSSSPSWDYRSRGHQPCHTRSGYDYNRGFQGLQISDSNARPLSDNKPLQVGSCSLPPDAGRGFNLGRCKSSAAFRLESPGPENSSPESKSEPSPAFLTKNAVRGHGFSTGRGKSPAASQLESPEPASQMSSSSSWDYRPRGHRQCLTRSGYDYNRGFQGLQISDPNARPLSDNKPQEVGSSSLPSNAGRGFNVGQCKSPAAFHLGSPGPASQVSSSLCWDYGNKGCHQPRVANPDNRGSQGLRISDTNARRTTSVRPQQVVSDFCPSSRGGTEDWRFEKLSRAEYASAGRAPNTDTVNYAASAGPVRSMGRNYAANAGPAWNTDTGRNYAATAESVRSADRSRDYGASARPAWSTDTGRNYAVAARPAWNMDRGRSYAASAGPAWRADIGRNYAVAAGPAWNMDTSQNYAESAGPARNTDRDRNYAASAGEAQSMDTGRNFAVGAGPAQYTDTGRGRGWGRGWYSSQS